MDEILSQSREGKDTGGAELCMCSECMSPGFHQWGFEPRPWERTMKLG